MNLYNKESNDRVFVSQDSDVQSIDRTLSADGHMNDNSVIQESKFVTKTTTNSVSNIQSHSLI